MPSSLALGLITWALFLPLIRSGPTNSRDSNKSSCRCLPGDDCWPGPEEWAKLNATVQGRLIATVPLGAPCHDPSFNATECSALQAEWPFPPVHFSSASSIMAPYFQTCDPYTPETSPCAMGNHVSYSINVSSADDAAAGIKFARKNNIRLVIRNTGHEHQFRNISGHWTKYTDRIFSFLGKSTGKGGLALWMHNLKSIEFLDYKSKDYRGPAIKMGAGVQVFEAYSAAHAQGLRVVGGTCPTVGLAGGYTQGGGHSTLSSTYGLSADQTLEWEVVTADGELVTASPTENSDLYWALSGGGGGTYGVVLSLTSKAHQDGEIGGASMLFTAAGVSLDTFWDAVGLWHASLPEIVDSGVQATHAVASGVFLLRVLTWPGHSEEEVTTLLQPFITALKDRSITYSLNVGSSPNFIEHFTKFIGPLPFGPPEFNADQLTGGRLVPRSVVQNNNAALTAAFRSISNSNFFLVGFGVNVSHAAVGNTPSSNAVLPAWRDAIMSIMVGALWDFTIPREQNVQKEDDLTNIAMPQIEAVTPGSGAYMNEANFQQKNWQEDFFGGNYERLRKVKAKYDPHDLFYATTAVGSEAWTVASDGRLCRSADSGR